MSKKHFGTDGVRGVANEKLSPEFALALGSAVGRFIIARGLERSVVIGRDTRRSGPMLGAAFAAGLCAEGVDVSTLGVAPTGAISYVVRNGPHSLAAVISASHNPAPDNGIKLFAHDGKKVADDDEMAIESLLDEPSATRTSGRGVGDLQPNVKALEAYENAILEIIPEGLRGMKVAFDGAHGAGYAIGSRVLRTLGAEVFETGCDPDGFNINAEGGATKPSTIGEFTVSSGADIGVAFDGDADRAVFCDERGRLINGDRTMAVWATYWRDQGRFHPATIVGTVMSNGGFASFLNAHGIELIRAAVGDKYVSQAMSESGAKVGGEQSGHIIFSERGPTGDGLVTMLEFLRVIQLAGKSASAQYDAFENWPQILLNLKLESREGWDRHPQVVAALNEAESILAGAGRINVRASGTMPMLRLMVEAADSDRRDQAAEKIFRALESAIGASVHSRVDLTHALGD
ncbi:MAG: Phosphoglucosamine mutase [Fimbriimonadaceae bacterium]|nr:Phosphoglucosamine mutase [Fimbriimonadaceae bacterium]